MAGEERLLPGLRDLRAEPDHPRPPGRNQGRKPALRAAPAQGRSDTAARDGDQLPSLAGSKRRRHRRIDDQGADASHGARRRALQGSDDRERGRDDRSAPRCAPRTRPPLRPERRSAPLLQRRARGRKPNRGREQQGRKGRDDVVRSDPGLAATEPAYASLRPVRDTDVAAKADDPRTVGALPLDSERLSARRRDRSGTREDPPGAHPRRIPAPMYRRSATSIPRSRRRSARPSCPRRASPCRTSSKTP